MSKRKNEYELIEVKPIITSPKKYRIVIKGIDSILMNRDVRGPGSKVENVKQNKENPYEVERKTWREKTYFDDQNNIYIPGENIHESFKDGSRYWGQKIPGEGNKTYTDVIASGIVVENMYLGLKKDNDKIIPFGKMCNGNPSKGKKSGTKVYKIRPLIRPWGGETIIHVYDARLSLHVLSVIIGYAGGFKGLCDWRPVFGRYILENIEEVI